MTPLEWAGVAVLAVACVVILMIAAQARGLRDAGRDTGHDTEARRKWCEWLRKK
jgi:hypothetical protein